jgi:hypothetical protein
MPVNKRIKRCQNFATNWKQNQIPQLATKLETKGEKALARFVLDLKSVYFKK